jgi:hypothetical protein
MADLAASWARLGMIAGLMLLGLVGEVQAQVRSSFSPWRQQSRDEPPWVTREQSANYAPLEHTRTLPKDSLSWRGLDPVMADRVERLFNAAQSAGLDPSFVSGFRPGAYQQQLGSAYASGSTGGIQAQPSNRSFHTMGYAVDMQIGKPELMLEFVQLAHQFNLAFTVDGDPNHIELVDPSSAGPTAGDPSGPISFRQFLDLGIPKQFRACSDCGPRSYVPRPSADVAKRVQREYQIRKEVTEFLEKSRRDMDRLRLEKPDSIRSKRSENYRSVFGNDYKFDNPFGGSESDSAGTKDGSGFFGDWTFDDIKIVDAN